MGLKLCQIDGCTKLAQRGGLCVMHGAKRKLCKIDGCTNNVVKGGVCVTHGAKRKLCEIDGCTNQAKVGGVCIRHGANTIGPKKGIMHFSLGSQTQAKDIKKKRQRKNRALNVGKSEILCSLY